MRAVVRGREPASAQRPLAAAAIGAACGLLLYRIAPDVADKPLYEDEAVAGLISMRPLGEVLETVMLDRGGAPLHFVLTHGVFAVDTSAEALRWLSVVCAVAAVPLCFDLGRRLGGTAAGLVAAAVVASSTALAVYGSFGRMYALYVLVAALAADLFVRAVELRTRGAVAAAAAAFWLLPAVHPYGLIPALGALAVAAVHWQRRSLRDALPVAVAVVAAIPFVLADLRLADRSEVGEGGSALASPGDAWGELIAAVAAFAGGSGVLLVVFTALAVAGLVVLATQKPAVAVLGAAVAVPPVLFVLVPAGSEPDLSPRHLFYGLPLWAAAIGVGVAWLRRWIPERAWPLVVAAVIVLAAVAPASALEDPRELGLLPTGTPATVEAGAGDLLFPYATPFLAELGGVRDALALPQGPGDQIVRTLEHADEPIRAVHVALPREEWAVVTLQGPFDEQAALRATEEAIATAPHPPELDWWYDLVARGLRDALSRYTAAPWRVNASSWRLPSARDVVPPTPGASVARASSPASSTDAGRRRTRSASMSASFAVS
jgi:Dolichyl-phosphate-mannose-protein mannosyltransferase